MHSPATPVTKEIKRQLDLLSRERWGRLPLTCLALFLTVIYLPLWFSMLCLAINITAELASMLYMRGLDPKQTPNRYRFVMACMFVMQFSYTLPAALIWQGDANYAKAFAVGMILTTLMQLISARTIHMPFGYMGFAAVAVPVLVANPVYWLGTGDLAGLAFSTIATFGCLAYTLIAMRSNHHLHRTSARDREAALESMRGKSRFLAQMSHELRTPLNAILGMGHAELRRNRDTLAQNRLSVLIASAEGLSTILDDILDMSAIEVGRLPIRPVPVSPSEEINATLALFQPGILEAGLTLTHDIARGLDRIWMLDPQRLRQCLSNLLSNAMKNTLRGGIHVTARQWEDGTGMMLRIEVADTGQGIPAHLHRTLFDPFVQARTPRAGAESNGLGLSISRTMAQQMGGDLTIADNLPDQTGARFVLTLRMDVAAQNQTATAPPPPEVKAAPPRTAGLKVLVIDDIATNRLVASTYLRMLGATMIEAASGAEALDILAREHPDLVLLDMNMPEMNGLQTLEKIRALPGRLGKLPVIAMTADAMADHRSLYLAAGVDGYLAKPINPARIEAEITAVLEKAGAV